jgi:hypothetical protein
VGQINSAAHGICQGREGGWNTDPGLGILGSYLD